MTSVKRIFVPAGVLIFAVAATGAGCGDDTVASTSSGPGGTGGTATGTGNPTVGGGGTGGEETGGGGAGGMETGGGGMGGMGGMGGTPEPDTGDDMCPGDPYALNLPSTQLLLGGDTSTATDLYQQTFCGVSQVDGPERVYDFTLNGTGTLSVDVRPAPGSTLNPTLSVQAGGMCDDLNNGFNGCFSFFTSQEGFAAEFGPDATAFGGIFALSQFHVIIDSANGTTGEYVLDVSFTDGVCGDRAVNTVLGEECDDGNVVNGDGCSAGCQFEVTSVFDSCPGNPVSLPTVGSTALEEGGTWGYSDDYTSPSCGPNVFDFGKDLVYNIIVGQPGTLSAKIGYGMDGVTDVCEVDGLSSPNCWDRVLYLVGPTVCETAPMTLGPQVACANAGVFTPEELTAPVQQGNYYLCLLYTSPSPRDLSTSRMPSSA